MNKIQRGGMSIFFLAVLIASAVAAQQFKTSDWLEVQKMSLNDSITMDRSCFGYPKPDLFKVGMEDWQDYGGNNYYYCTSKVTLKNPRSNAAIISLLKNNPNKLVFGNQKIIPNGKINLNPPTIFIKKDKTIEVEDFIEVNNQTQKMMKNMTIQVWVEIDETSVPLGPNRNQEILIFQTKQPDETIKWDVNLSMGDESYYIDPSWNRTYVYNKQFDNDGNTELLYHLNNNSFDSSGNANNFTFDAGSIYTLGLFGTNATRGQGVTSKTVNFGEDGALEFWFMADPIPNSTRQQKWVYDQITDNYFDCPVESWLNANIMTCRFLTSELKFNKSKFDNGTWYHILISWNKSTGEIGMWINDTLVNQQVYNNNTIVRKLYIGRSSITSDQDFDGDLEEFRVYNLSLIPVLPALNDPTMSVNITQVWNHSGAFWGPETVGNFSDEINAFLNNCVAEADGTCLVPLNFSAQSNGSLNVSNLYINYTVYDTIRPVINNISATPNPSNASEVLSVKVNASDNVGMATVNATLVNTEITLSFNGSSRLYEGTLIAPGQGIYYLNISVIDSSNLTQTNNTKINVTSSSAELTLTANDIMYDPLDPLETDVITINASIHNYGRTAANGFLVELLMDDVSQQNKTVSVGATSMNITTFTWTTIKGNHTIEINIDPSLSIAEANESNNNANITVSVGDTNPPTIHKVIVNPVIEGTTLPIRVNVSDDVAVSKVTAKINNTVVTLTLNASSGFYENSTQAPNDGTYDVTVTATDNSGLATTQLSTDIIYSSGPDLFIDRVFFSYLPLRDDDAVNISVIVRNTGGASANPSLVRFSIDGVVSGEANISVPASGTNVTVFTNETRYGTHVLTFTADVNGVISEANESNNLLNMTVSVIDADPPVIHKVILPTSVYVSSNLSIKVNVTDNVNVSGVNATLDGVSHILAYNSSTGLYENVTVAPSSSGTYNITILAVDKDGLRSQRVEMLRVNPSGADLTLDSSDVKLMPRDPKEPENLEVNVTIRNEGGTDTSNFTLHLNVNGGTQDKSLSVKKASSNSTTFNWTSLYSNHTLIVTADYNNHIAEANESNNNYTTTIFVVDITPPPAPNASASPSGWGSQTTHTISWSTVSDVNGIDHYEYQTDYGAWRSVGLNTSFITPSQADGVHIVYVRAVDTPGNLGSQGNVSVYIDNSGPNTPVIREWHSGNNWTRHSTPYYTWADPGDTGSGVTTYVGKLDGNQAGLGNNESYHATVSSGNHTFMVFAQDAVSQNSSWSNTISVLVDVTNPSLTNISSSTHPGNTTQYNITTPVFNFSAYDNHSGLLGFYYVVDQNTSTIPQTTNLWTTNSSINVTGIGGSIPSINGSRNQSGLVGGDWYIHVRAKDTVGNVGNASHYLFRINTSINTVNESGGRIAIEVGINTSVLVNFTIFTDQQLYVHYLNTTQRGGLFDKVVMSGNQTWAFNYVTGNESFTNISGLENYTLVTWEDTLLSANQVTNAVKTLINRTKWQ